MGLRCAALSATKGGADCCLRQIRLPVAETRSSEINTRKGRAPFLMLCGGEATRRERRSKRFALWGVCGRCCYCYCSLREREREREESPTTPFPTPCITRKIMNVNASIVPTSLETRKYRSIIAKRHIRHKTPSTLNTKKQKRQDTGVSSRGEGGGGKHRRSRKSLVPE